MVEKKFKLSVNGLWFPEASIRVGLRNPTTIDSPRFTTLPEKWREKPISDR